MSKNLSRSPLLSRQNLSPSPLVGKKSLSLSPPVNRVRLPRVSLRFPPRSPPRSSAKPRAAGADAFGACGRRFLTSGRGPHSRGFAREPPAPDYARRLVPHRSSAACAGGSRAPCRSRECGPARRPGHPGLGRRAEHHSLKREMVSSLRLHSSTRQRREDLIPLLATERLRLALRAPLSVMTLFRRVQWLFSSPQLGGIFVKYRLTKCSSPLLLNKCLSAASFYWIFSSFGQKLKM